MSTYTDVEGAGGPDPCPLQNDKALAFLAILIRIPWKIKSYHSLHPMLSRHQSTSKNKIKNVIRVGCGTWLYRHLIFAPLLTLPPPPPSDKSFWIR